MKKKSVKVIFFLTIIGVLALCHNISSTFASERPKFIKIAASSMGGTWFPICAATSEILNTSIKETIFTATLGGGITNLKNIEAGNLYMGLTNNSVVYLATEGDAPFTKKAKKTRLVCMYYTYPYNLVVHADSDIYSIKDLEGKRISGGKKGWGTEQFFRNLLKVQGISYETIIAKGGHVTYAGWSQMRTMFKDKKLDFILDGGVPPSPGLMEITALRPIRLLQVNKEAIEEIKKFNPAYSTLVTPGGLYRGQDKPVTCIAEPIAMIISGDLADDFVYEITKGILENSKELIKIHAVLKGFSPENALEGAYLTLHPGAYKYYKEKGIPVAEHLRP